MINKYSDKDQYRQYYNEYFADFVYENFGSIPAKQNFLNHRILYIKNNYHKQCKIFVKYTEKKAKIIVYDVFIQNFKLEIILLNFNTQGSPQCTNQKQLGCGSFGNVRMQNNTHVKFAVKRQYFSHQDQLLEMRANKYEIDSVIREYSIYKICSLYGIGPSVVIGLGFDILCFNDCIEFHLELCQKIQQKLFKNQDQLDQHYHNKFIYDMKKNVFLLHKIKIIHKDIKPANILFSQASNKFILSDFGISVGINQKIGEKTRTLIQGTRNFFSPQMYEKYKNGQYVAFVNLYQNDRYALQLTLKEQTLRKYKQKMINKQKDLKQMTKKQIQNTDKIFVKRNIEDLEQFHTYNNYKKQNQNTIHSKNIHHQQQMTESNQININMEKEEITLQQIKINLENGIQQLLEFPPQMLKKETSYTQISQSDYQYLKLKFISLKQNSKFIQTESLWQYINDKQIIEILSIVQQSMEYNKILQVYNQVKDLPFENFKIKQLIESLRIQSLSITQMKIPIKQKQFLSKMNLANYIRGYGYIPKIRDIIGRYKIDGSTIVFTEKILSEISHHERYNKNKAYNIDQIGNIELFLKFIQENYQPQHQQLILINLYRLIFKKQGEKLQQKLLILLEKNNFVFSHHSQFYHKWHQLITYIRLPQNKMEVKFIMDKIQKLQNLMKQIESDRNYLRMLIKQLLIKSYSMILNVLLDLNAIEQCIRSIAQKIIFLTIVDTELSENAKIIKFNTLYCNIFYRKHEYKAALSCALKIQQVLKKQNLEETLEIAQIYNIISDIFIKMENFSQAIIYQFKSLSILNKMTDQIQKGLIQYRYYNISYLLTILNKNEQALQFCFKSINHYSQKNSKEFVQEQMINLATTYHHLSCSYYRLDNYQKALEYQKKSFSIRIKYLPQDHHDIANSYHQFSCIQTMYFKNYEKALEYAFKSKLILEMTNPTQNLSDCFYNISFIYHKMQKYNEAYEYAENSLGHLLSLNFKYNQKIGYCYYRVAESYFALKNYREAYCFVNFSLSIFTQNFRSNQMLYESFNLLSLIELELKNFNQCLKYTQKAIEVLKKSTKKQSIKLIQIYFRINYIQQILLKKVNLDYLNKIAQLLQYLNFEQLKQNKDFIFCYQKISEFFYNSQIKKSLEFALKTITLIQKLYNANQKNIQVSDSFYWVSCIYEKLGQFSKALPMIIKSLNFHPSIQNQFNKYLANKFYHTSLLYNKLQMYQQALIYHHKYHSILQILGIDPSSEDCGERFYLSASIYFNLNNTDQAFRQAQQSLLIFKKYKNYKRIGQNLMFLSKVCAKKNDDKRALQYALWSYYVQQKYLNADIYLKSKIQHQLALSYSDLSKLNKAISLSLQSVRYNIKQNIFHIQTLIGIYNLGCMYYDNNQILKAFTYFLICHDFSRKKFSEDHTLIKKNHNKLFLIYKSIPKEIFNYTSYQEYMTKTYNNIKKYQNNRLHQSLLLNKIIINAWNSNKLISIELIKASFQIVLIYHVLKIPKLKQYYLRKLDKLIKTDYREQIKFMTFIKNITD